MNKVLSAWVSLVVIGGFVAIAYLLAPFAKDLHNESIRSNVNQSRKACNDRIDLIKIACECPGGANEKVEIKTM